MCSNLGDTSFFVLFLVLEWFILVCRLEFMLCYWRQFFHLLDPKVVAVVNFISCMVWIFNSVWVVFLYLYPSSCSDVWGLCFCLSMITVVELPARDAVNCYIDLLGHCYLCSTE